jgi:uncharacterized protein YkwD
VPTIVSRITHKTLAAIAFIGIGATVMACQPAPEPTDCATIKSQYADAPVKDMTPQNAERADGADTHTNPDGKGPADRIRAAGYCPSPTYWKVAENTYWGWGVPAQTPRDAVEWWMGSHYHRLNILDPDLNELGVGVALGAPRPGNYPDAAVFVQNFGTCR